MADDGIRIIQETFHGRDGFSSSVLFKVLEDGRYQADVAGRSEALQQRSLHAVAELIEHLTPGNRSSAGAEA